MSELMKIILAFSTVVAVTAAVAIFTWLFIKIMDWLIDEPTIILSKPTYRKSSFTCKHPNDEKYKNNRRLICKQSCLYCKYNPKNNE